VDESSSLVASTVLGRSVHAKVGGCERVLRSIHARSRPRLPPRGDPSNRRGWGCFSRPARDCESCLSIDVRQWHRRGLLRHAGQRFSSSWNRSGEPLGSIDVRTEADAVVLLSREVASGDPSSSACRSYGRSATSAAHVPGFVAARLSATDPADGA
jgi:hypothetical protein